MSPDSLFDSPCETYDDYMPSSIDLSLRARMFRSTKGKAPRLRRRERPSNPDRGGEGER